MDALRNLPSVHELLEAATAGPLLAANGRPLVLFAIQRVLEEERRAGVVSDSGQRWKRIEGELQLLRRPRLRPVINATGVVLHTNLGRAPLAAEAAEAAASISGRYSTLELDLRTGKRGVRHELVEDVLRHLTGAEAAAVVNNCAAATVLMLGALARGKEVIVSRGELIEIGGAFRMPEIMRLSGARMVEVGTTNRTRAEDYERAITPRTAAILKVHASNFQVVGFTESAGLAELAAVAHRQQLLMLHDLGSGALLDTTAFGLQAEPRVQESLEMGVDVVVCSGDKLLGGPQAGLLLGRRALIDRLLKHPLARAVRVDKMTLAALAATLEIYLIGAAARLPVWQMIGALPEALAERASAWARALADAGIAAELTPGLSTVGGGSLPGEQMPTTLLVLMPRRGGATRLLEALRHHDPPVIARIEGGRVLLDPRTVLAEEDDDVVNAVSAALR